MLRQPWRIELLNGIRAFQDKSEVNRFRTQKTALLPVYPAYHALRRIPREEVAGVVWPEGDAITFRPTAVAVDALASPHVYITGIESMVGRAPGAPDHIRTTEASGRNVREASLCMVPERALGAREPGHVQVHRLKGRLTRRLLLRRFSVRGRPRHRHSYASRASSPQSRSDRSAFLRASPACRADNLRAARDRATRLRAGLLRPDVRSGCPAPIVPVRCRHRRAAHGQRMQRAAGRESACRACLLPAG